MEGRQADAEAFSAGTSWWKADLTPVTIADREAETRVRELFAQAYPDDGIATCSPPLVGLKPAIWPSERV